MFSAAAKSGEDYGYCEINLMLAAPQTGSRKEGLGFALDEAVVPLLCAEWGLHTKIFRYQTRCPRKPTRSAFHSSDGSK
jgi:hypothetical protein